MNYEHEINKELYKDYVLSLRDSFFKILYIYEESCELQDFNNYQTYIDSLIIQMIGTAELFEDRLYYTLMSYLIGLSNTKDLTKKKVKSVTFGCCNRLHKKWEGI